MKSKLLLIDDDAEILEGYARLLKHDYDLHLGSSGQEALDLLSSEGPFDALISDQEMPGMKGTELLVEVQAKHPDVVCVMLTGVDGRELAVEAFQEAKAFRFLSKPASFETLRGCVEEACTEAERRRTVRGDAERLQFSKEALGDLLNTLEARIEVQTEALSKLQNFVYRLSTVESVGEVSEVVAETCYEVMDERNVSVELSDGSDEGRVHCSQVGEALTDDAYLQDVSSHEGNIGTIRVSEFDRHDRQISAADRNMLASIAATAAVAVHNQLRRAERDDAQHATIMAMALLAEQRDNETGRHLERVSEYSQLVAEGLREDGKCLEVINDVWIRDLYHAVPLHDIGKVGIPDSILLKPGKLDPEEWEIMKQHTTIGAQTLSTVIGDYANSELLEMSLEIAWCHHEKWDGSGYPRSLKNTNIPLSARILALADVYDALTTVRPYKRAWSHKQALEWIASGSGTHFDPDIVEAFVRRAEKANTIRARLADGADGSDAFEVERAA